jgi:hypothetical protein
MPRVAGRLVMQVGVMWVSMYETLMLVPVAVRFLE